MQAVEKLIRAAGSGFSQNVSRMESMEASTNGMHFSVSLVEILPLSAACILTYLWKNQ